jgi:hypothetical protein
MLSCFLSADIKYIIIIIIIIIVQWFRVILTKRTVARIVQIFPTSMQTECLLQRSKEPISRPRVTFRNMLFSLR